MRLAHSEAEPKISRRTRCARESQCLDSQSDAAEVWQSGTDVAKVLEFARSVLPQNAAANKSLSTLPMLLAGTFE